MHFFYYIAHIHCSALKNNLLHVCETITVVRYSISGLSYAFENYLQALKRFVQKPTQIMDLIYRKTSEVALQIKEEQQIKTEKKYKK